MLLDTTRADHEEETSGVRLRTPPGASEIISSTRTEFGLKRELLVDIMCAETLINRFGEESEAFRIIPIDVAKLISSGSTAFLSKATAIVVGSALSNGMGAIEAIQRLRGMIPHVGLYLVSRDTAEFARVLTKLAAAGVDEVFQLDSRTDMKAFEVTMRARLTAPAPETELRLLWKWFRESTERSLVMHCVRNGFRLDIWSIRSRVFGQCRKTLQNRVAMIGLPSPGILSRYGRVLHGQELERRGLKPTTAVASILGFPSAGAMQRSRRRLRKALMTRGRQALVFASLLK
jgi:hypothetical protein